MANASFTRDEVILALDVLYFSEVPHPTVQTKVMQELSALLNRLPIHPLESRDERFRNPTGVARQINLFRASKKSRKRDPNVGTRFYEIDAEFDGRKGELHSIATAIRRNERLYRAIRLWQRCGSARVSRGGVVGASTSHHRNTRQCGADAGEALRHLPDRYDGYLPRLSKSHAHAPDRACHGTGRSKAIPRGGFYRSLPQLPCCAAPAQAVADKRKVRRTAPLREGGKCHVWI